MSFAVVIQRKLHDDLAIDLSSTWRRLNKFTFRTKVTCTLHSLNCYQRAGRYSAHVATISFIPLYRSTETASCVNGLWSENSYQEISTYVFLL